MRVIPGFGLHWVFTLEDFMLHDGERELLRALVPTMDAVLGWFDRHQDGLGLVAGIVGPRGLWEYAPRPDAARLVSQGILRSLTALEKGQGERQTPVPRRPFRANLDLREKSD